MLWRDFTNPALVLAAVLLAGGPVSRANAQCNRPAINQNDTRASADFGNVRQITVTLREPIKDPETDQVITELTFPLAQVKFHIDVGYDAQRRRVSKLDVIEPAPADQGVLGTFDDTTKTDTVARDVIVHSSSGCETLAAAPDGQTTGSPLDRLDETAGLDGFVVTNATNLRAVGTVRYESNNLLEVRSDLADDDGGGEVHRTYRRVGDDWVLERARFRQQSESQLGTVVFESTFEFSNQRFFINRAEDARRRARTASGAGTTVAKAEAPPAVANSAYAPPTFDQLLSAAGAQGPPARAASDTVAVGAPGQNVVLQHGIFSNAGTWSTLDPWLARNYALGTKLMPSLSSTDRLEDQSKVLVERIARTNQGDFLFIGHSQGGLISRRAAQLISADTAGGKRVKGVITLDTPHNGALLVKMGELEMLKRLTWLGDDISFGCVSVLQDPGCFIGWVLNKGGWAIARYGLKAALPVSTDLMPLSTFQVDLRSRPEPFTSVSIESQSSARWVWMRFLGDSICEPHQGCGGRSWAKFTNYSYIGFRSCQAIAVFWLQNPGVASFCGNVAGYMDLIDAFYHRFYSGSTGGDGIVWQPGQAYFGATRRTLITGADSHAGVNKSDKVRDRLRTVLAENFNVPPRASTNPPPAGPLSVTNSMSYLPGVAAESLASAWGSGLSTQSEAAEGYCDLVLANRSVVVRDAGGEERSACLFFVSPGQINFQVPPGTTASDRQAASVIVRDAATHDDIAVLRNTAIPYVAPGLGYRVPSDEPQGALAIGHYLHVRGEQQTWTEISETPVTFTSGERLFLVLYGTGFRFGGSPRATIAGQAAPVVWWGPQGSLTGVDQLVIEVPASFRGRSGRHYVATSFGSLGANQVQVRLR